MNKKVRIIFRWSDHNHYSLSAIFGFLDDALDPEHFELMTGESLKDIYEKVNNTDSRCIAAFSFLTPQFENVKTEIKALKSHFKDKITIICGGPHSSALPESVLEAGADAVFTGECEESLPIFLNHFRQGIEIKDRVIQALPLKEFDLYPPFSMKRRFFGPIELRRGCSNRCSFCQTPQMFKCIRERSIKNVKKFVQYMKDSNRNRILFVTSDLLSYGLKNGKVNFPYIQEFFEEMKATGANLLLGNFPSEISPRRLSEKPEAAALIARHTTNRKMVIGGQSGSERVLKIMKRDHSVSDIEESVKLLSAEGFETVVDILFGVPGENSSDRKETLSLMKNLSKVYNARFNVHYFMPLPGTDFYKMKPEIIENEIKEEVYKFTKHGIAFGDFFTQEKYAVKTI